MKTRGHERLFAVILLGIAALVGPVEAAEDDDSSSPPERAGGAVGVGVLLGDLDGLSFKFWNGPSHVFHARVGSMSQLNSAGLIGTYEYHFRPVQVADKTFSLPFYAGGGARFAVMSTTDIYMDGGLLAVGGMSILVPDLPVELFIELRPTLLLYDPSVGTSSSVGLGFVLEGGFGAHYYF